MNNDGHLDLYVGHWNYLSRGGGFCAENDLYINNGDGTFTERAVELGVNDHGCTFAVAMSDYDADGDLDIIVVNDDLTIGVPWSVNELYRNDGLDTEGMPILSPVADVIGMDQLFAGMGIAIGDYNNDGLLDYYRSNAGLGYVSTNQATNVFNTVQHSTTDLWGWGAVFFDADNDGFVDLYRVNNSFGSAQNGLFFANEGGVLSTTGQDAAIGLAGASGSGVAVADYDNDGDVDILVHAGDGELGLYENITGNQNQSIAIQLSGAQPNLRGIGAKIIIDDGGVRQLREVHAGSSHGSTNSVLQHIGLGPNPDGRIDVMTIRWPGGCEERMGNVPDVASTIKVKESDCVGGTVEGTVMSNGTGLADVALTFVDQTGAMSGTVHGTATTAASGSYSVSGLPFRVPMRVKITRTGYNFTPSEGAVYLQAFNPQVTQNYTATPFGGSISGEVTDAVTGVGVPKATVRVNLGASETVTDGQGHYTFTGLAGYDYYVDAIKPGFSILGRGPVVVNGQDVSKDFIATCQGGSIAGRVTDASSGVGVSGATVQIDFGSIANFATTDAHGLYAATEIEGYDHYVTASNSGYSISGRGPIVVNGQCVDKDFSATAN